MKFHLVWLVLAGVAIMSSSTSAGDIVTEIIEGLGKNDTVKQDHRRLIQYLQMSDQEIVSQFPASNANGTLAGYTLFAPTNWAFSSLTPQDVADPYFDPDLRLKVLLRHFVPRRISVDDLASKLTSLTMASGEVFNITHDEGKILLNGAGVDTKSLIELPTVSIYVVDRVFAKSEEISDAISRHPPGVSFFGPLPATPYDQLPPFPSGGYNRVSVKDEQVVAAAAFAVPELSKSQSIGEELKLISIKSAAAQTFYGELHKLVLELETVKKDLRTCEVVIFQRNWIQETKLSSFHCVP